MHPLVMDSANIFTGVSMVFQARPVAWRHPGQRQQYEDMLKTFVVESIRSAFLAVERQLTGI